MDHAHPHKDHDYRCRECNEMIYGALPEDLTCKNCGSADVEEYRGVITCVECDNDRLTDRIPPSFLPNDVYCEPCGTETTHEFAGFHDEVEVLPS